MTNTSNKSSKSSNSNKSNKSKKSKKSSKPKKITLSFRKDKYQTTMPKITSNEEKEKQEVAKYNTGTHPLSVTYNESTNVNFPTPLTRDGLGLYNLGELMGDTVVGPNPTKPGVSRVPILGRKTPFGGKKKRGGNNKQAWEIQALKMGKEITNEDEKIKILEENLGCSFDVDNKLIIEAPMEKRKNIKYYVFDINFCNNNHPQNCEYIALCETNNKNPYGCSPTTVPEAVDGSVFNFSPKCGEKRKLQGGRKTRKFNRKSNKSKRRTRKGGTATTRERSSKNPKTSKEYIRKERKKLYLYKSINPLLNRKKGFPVDLVSPPNGLTSYSLPSPLNDTIVGPEGTVPIITEENQPFKK
ncbi:MAG: hypothetical protein CXT73_05810 [Methanobacteriota archaeon]|nr:MAG: hypothetical protein CXT73_05810 [Euryarchaeota archaeon]